MTEHKENYSWVYIGLATIIGGVILYWLFFSTSPGYIKVKYRDDKVNISSSNFEPLNSSDSTVKGGWYDSANKYMVIRLGDTYYPYCGIPSEVWDGLKTSLSSYNFYKDSIKGNFDCRVNPAPQY